LFAGALYEIISSRLLAALARSLSLSNVHIPFKSSCHFPLGQVFECEWIL